MNAVLMQSWNSFLGTESILFINDATGFNGNTPTKDQQISPPKMMLPFFVGRFSSEKSSEDWCDTSGFGRWQVDVFFLRSFGHHGGYSSIDTLLRTRKLAEEQLKQFWRPSVFLEMFFVTHRNSIIEADDWYFQDLWLFFAWPKDGSEAEKCH